ncbi:MAG: ferrochelatase [Patescibacteria group bacterium]|nr:ferrochelatase [Patescibacteria group bacterium]
MADFDALLLTSFGGPDGPDDVLPFLENVVRHRPVPRSRLEEVAEHYSAFGGVSPINAENRALLTALIAELNANGPPLSVYWGNRNWHPLLEDTVRQMADDGIRHALAFCTSAFGSYPGCRQYREDLQQAQAAIGERAPRIDKLRLFYNHPGFVEVMAERAGEALAQMPEDRRDSVAVVFTAHSLPVSMANSSPYQRQLEEACRLVAERVGVRHWHLAFQSRSGPPTQPWLEPELAQTIRSIASAGGHYLVLVPIGFVSEHMEVVYDLDVEAAGLCEELGLDMVRAGTVGCHPRFVQMIRQLVTERIEPLTPRLALGNLGTPPDACSPDCCPRP